MNVQLPVRERPLPPRAAAQMRTSIMAVALTPRPVHRPGRIWLAAAVLAVLVGSGFLVWTRMSGPVIVAPAAVNTAGDLVEGTDLGGLTAAESQTELALCLRPGDPAVQTVISARRLTDGHEPFPWVVYRNVDDQVAVCSKRLSGPTYGGERKFTPSDRYPVVPLGGMNSGSWLPDQTAVKPTEATGYTSGQFFAAGPEVATVQLRAVINGVPGKWFAGSVHNGFVYVPVFEAGPVPLDANEEPQLSFEHRAFDRAGFVVRVR